MTNKLRSHNEDKLCKIGYKIVKWKNDIFLKMEVTNLLIKDEVCILDKKSGETQINPVVAPSLIVFSMHGINIL